MARKLAVLLSVPVLVFGSFWLFGARKSRSEKPTGDYSVLLITIDSLSAGYLGSYGYHRDTSPHLDEFANQHVRFTRAFGQSFYSGPSHSSLLTSLYPRTHGVFRNSIPLDDELLTIQEVLKAHGYRTGAVVNTALLGTEFNYQQGFDFFQVVRGYPKTDGSGETYNVVFPVAAKWIRENKDRKFFFWLQVNYVHSFYKPPEPYRYLWYSQEDLTRMNIRKEYRHHRDLWEARNRGILTEDEVAFAKSQYDGEIVYTDQLLHEFLTEVQQSVSLEDMLVVITADHGEIFDYQNNRFGHGHHLYEDVIHVPLIMNVPPINGWRFESMVIDEVVQGIDIAPTILDLLGIKIPAAFQGISFADFFRDEPRPIHSELYLGVGIVGEPVAIRKDGWKLIYYDDDWMELYHIAEDPHEDRDLASSADEELKRLLTLYKRWTRFVPHYDMVKLRQKRETLRPKIIEILERAGYLEDEAGPGRK